MITRNKVQRKMELDDTGNRDLINYMMLITSADSGTEYVEEEDRDEHIDPKEYYEDFGDGNETDFRKNQL